MVIEREKVAKFWKYTVGSWDASRRNADKWIDKATEAINRWQLPMSKVKIERHGYFWYWGKLNIQYIDGKLVDLGERGINPNRKGLERKAVMLNGHFRG